MIEFSRKRQAENYLTDKYRSFFKITNDKYFSDENLNSLQERANKIPKNWFAIFREIIVVLSFGIAFSPLLILFFLWFLIVGISVLSLKGIEKTVKLFNPRVKFNLGD